MKQTAHDAPAEASPTAALRRLRLRRIGGHLLRWLGPPILSVALALGAWFGFDSLWGSPLDYIDIVDPTAILPVPTISMGALLVVLALVCGGLYRQLSQLAARWSIPAPWLRASPERSSRYTASLEPPPTTLHTALAGGFTLIGGEERWPTEALLATARSLGRPLLHRTTTTGLREAELLSWLNKLPSAPAAPAAPLVVIEGADALLDWVAAERPDARIIRALRTCRRELERSGADVVIVEPFPLDILLRHDRDDEALANHFHQTLIWDGGALRPPGRASGGIGWWLSALGTGAVDCPAGLRWSRRVGSLLALQSLITVAILLCLPGLRLDGSLPLLLGDGRDALPGSLWANSFLLDWMKGEVELGQTTRIFWPYGGDLTVLFGNLLPSFFAAPVQALFGYPGYWNLFVIAVLVANGLSARWLARLLGADPTGALLAGIAFASATPLLREVATGHQLQFFAFPLPLAIGMGLRALHQGSGWAALRAGLFIALAALSWWFYGAFALIIVALVGIDRWRKIQRERPSLQQLVGRLLRVLAPVALVAGPLVASANRGEVAGIGWLEIPSTAQPSMIEGFLAEVSIQGSTSLSTFLGGEATGGGLLGREGLLIAGLFATLLTLLPAVAWLLLPGRRRRFWVLVAAVSAILSLGPVVEFGGERYYAPFAVIEALVPFSARIGPPDRFLILSAVAMSVLLGLAYRPLLQWLPRVLRTSLPVVVMVLAPSLGLLSGFLPLSTFTFNPPRWLNQIGEPGAIAELPIGWSEHLAIYEPLRGHDSLMGGPGVVRQLHAFSTFRTGLDSDPALSFFRTTTSQLRSLEPLVELRARGFRYVAVNNLVLRSLVGTDGGNPDVQMALQVSQRVDEVLGPPVLRGPEVTVYRIPDRLR